MEKISVIVPVYNVESFLDRCIESIVNQTYANLEIILVDDGSPDNCGKICDFWVKKDPRIKVIHKENGGLSDARNAGLNIATGEFIAFVDSDDLIDKNMYQVLHDSIDEYHCDVSVCKIARFTEEIPCLKNSNAIFTRFFSPEDALKELISDGCIQQVVWNKLYRREIIQGISFVVGKLHEDEFWTYQILGKASGIIFTDYIGYFYYQRANSIIGKTYSLKRLDALEAKVLRHQYIKDNFPTLENDSLKNLWFTCLYHGQNAHIHLSKVNHKQVFHYIKSILYSHPLSSSLLHFCSFKEKLWLYAAKFAFVITCKLRNIFKIGF